MLITSCICLSCNNSNREIIYSYVNGYGDAHLTLGNVGGWGAEVKSHEYKNGIGKITFKSTITSIPEFAFINSIILKSITIPNSVTEIGDGAFRGCGNLSTVYCNATTPPNGGCLMFSYYKYNYEHFRDSHTEHKNLKCKIYVPTASVSAYKTAKNWSDYADNIVGYDF